MSSLYVFGVLLIFVGTGFAVSQSVADEFSANMDEIDFERREWVPNSGWPISLQDVQEHYRRAEDILEIDYFEDDDVRLAEGSHPARQGEAFATRAFSFSPPVRFGKKYAEELTRSSRITTLLTANVLELTPTESGAGVRAIRVADYGGRERSIEAGQFVLAAGGIENCRLLLNSTAQDPAGLGNTGGAVGRYFMGHPVMHAGVLVSNHGPITPYLVRKGLRFGHFAQYQTKVNFEKVKTKLGAEQGRIALPSEFRPPQYSFALSEAYQRQHGLLNTAFTVDRHYEMSDDERNVALNLLATRNPDIKPSSEYLSLMLAIRPEQAPLPESRVKLIETKDQFGKRRVRVDWQLGAQDFDSMERSIHVLNGELARTSSGLLKVLMRQEEIPLKLWTGAHHIGGTRMSDDPSTGVVDKNCKVHGLDNLYIAGCSVFPTSGMANPTLTLTALAVRLAKHIAS